MNVIWYGQDVVFITPEKKFSWKKKILGCVRVGKVHFIPQLMHNLSDLAMSAFFLNWIALLCFILYEALTFLFAIWKEIGRFYSRCCKSRITISNETTLYPISFCQDPSSTYSPRVSRAGNTHFRFYQLCKMIVLWYCVIQSAISISQSSLRTRFSNVVMVCDEENKKDETKGVELNES